MMKKQKRSEPSLAREFILEALERREDMILSDIAQIRDTKKANKVAHHDAWK